MYYLYFLILFLFILAMMFSIAGKLPFSIKNPDLLLPFYKIANTFLPNKNSYLLKQKMKLLYPSANPNQMAKEVYIKKAGLILFLIFLGNGIALIGSLTALNHSNISQGNLIQRNDYGGGEKRILLDILADGEIVAKDEEVGIGERQYTEEEIQGIFLQMEQELEEAILSKNDSLDVVCYNLSLPDSLQGYPVEIEWEISDQTVMNKNGEIKKEQIEKSGTPVELTAILSYLSFQEEHHFFAVLYPLPQSEEAQFYEKILELLKLYEKKTAQYDQYILPEELDGKKLSYQEKGNNQNGAILLLSIFAAIFAWKGKDQDMEKELKKREQQMMMDYPKIISKMILLLSAGMTIRKAFEKIAEDGEVDRYAFIEMKITIQEMRGGISESEAYIHFGDRSGVQKYRKFGAMLSQNLRKGSQGMLQMMATEEKDAFEERKSLARKLGEEAGTKLLLPMGMMLIVVMIIVIIPAFLSFSI